MRVSLILTTFNCAGTITQVLKSIEKQNYPDLEIVIKDGLSTDGTIHILEEYANSSSKNVVWKSQSDQGIYDAMNQGFLLSHGEVIAFCSDVLADENVVTDMVKAILNAGNSCIGAHGDLVYVEGQRVKRYWHMANGTINKGWMPGHPTLYLKRAVYEEYGLYKTNYKIAADYELMVRVLFNRENTLAYVPRVVVRMYYGGTSTSSYRSYWKSFMEGNRALKENGIVFPTAISIRRTIKLLSQFREARKYQFNNADVSRDGLQ